MIRWYRRRWRDAPLRARLWHGAAVALAVSAIVVSVVRHEAIGTPARQTTTAPSVATPAQASTGAALPATADLEVRRAYVSARIETSLFEDAHQAGLSEALTLKLIEIFGWDIDFALDIKPGDSFSVIHEEKYWMGQKIGDGAILAAEFVSRGTPHHAFGFLGKDGVTKYYEIDGITKRKRFLRTPIEFSRISSRYTDRATRFHPILKIWTAHRGVDYAAPEGTPIRATADGRIVNTEEFKSFQSNGGYGNSIMIWHDAAYSTIYAHMSRFAPNIRPGSMVVQGQIIGYVGHTGLATGPHLHYEFLVRGIHRDPLQYKFPGEPIPPEDRQAFFALAESLIAQLEVISDRHLAKVR